MNIGAFIVDDEEDIRSLIRVIIDAADHGLFVAGEAADGEEALKQVDQVDPEVVVIDEKMPGMGGVETATLILKRRPGQRIILCSAFLDAELRERAEAAGIKVCVAKGEVGRIPDKVRELVGQQL